jgi:hypothetical protein
VARCYSRFSKRHDQRLDSIGGDHRCERLGKCRLRRCDEVTDAIGQHLYGEWLGHYIHADV